MSLHQSASSHGRHSQHQQKCPVEKAVRIFYFKIFSSKAWFTSLLWFWLTSSFSRVSVTSWQAFWTALELLNRGGREQNAWQKIAIYELLPLCYVCILRFWQSVSPSDLKSLCHRGHPKKRDENVDSMHIWNLLPDRRREEKRGDLLEGQRRVPILWHTRLRLRLLKRLQWPRHNQI